MPDHTTRILMVAILSLAVVGCASKAAGGGQPPDNHTIDGGTIADGGLPGTDGGVLPDGAAATCFDLDGDGYGTGALCAGPDCNDDDPAIYPGATEVCDGVDNNCDGNVDEGLGAGCCASIDNDFDGVDACNDCDDSNGSIYPGAIERCNGLDDDCDGLVDEDFDSDGDGYSVCATDPLLFDCDDNAAGVNPGAAEDCGASGQGNGIDENCNGWVDEGCAPCDSADGDGDGLSECDGDCDNSDPDIGPGQPEVCDGKDNDCNKFTVENCGVSDPCNIDGDGDPSNDADVCQDDLLCACVVNASGQCQGNYVCTSFCNTSATGPVGDGCGANMTCLYDLLRAANVHGCGVSTDPVGTLEGGAPCSNDSECRSLRCERVCIGPGCNQNYCLDFCGSDRYCTAPGTVCRLQRTSANIDGRCWPDDGPFLGTQGIGASCGADQDCDHGFCSRVSSECTEACCRDADCPSGYTCSLSGDAIDTNYVFTPPGAATCTVDGDCASNICFNGECAFRLVETSPMCLPDVTSQGTRPAGAKCDTNTDCRSNFCDSALSVCVEVCCSDDTCPTGLTCELQRVRVPGGTDQRVTQSRICVNQPTDGVWDRM